MDEYIEHQKLKELKANKKNWETWCDCKILSRHYCKHEDQRKSMIINDAAIFNFSENDSADGWMYAHVWLADEKEIYDGEAEEIGEVISCYCFRIAFCPFCGEELGAN
jgi:hypothetical protein